MKSPAELAARYRAEGYKITPQRTAVFAALHGNSSHPNAEAVYSSVSSALPNISLRTIYSVLHELVELGELTQIDLGDGSARFDPNNAPHHHLICTACGTVHDVTVEVPLGGGGLRPEFGPGAAGFEIDDAEIVFRGTCRGCRNPSTNRK